MKAILLVTLLASLFNVNHARYTKRQNGWTLNSIGYNAGLNALQKLFGPNGNPNGYRKRVSSGNRFRSPQMNNFDTIY